MLPYIFMKNNYFFQNKKFTKRVALFYMSTNHNRRQLHSHIYLCNLLQCIALVKVSEDHLASQR